MSTRKSQNRRVRPSMATAARRQEVDVPGGAKGRFQLNENGKTVFRFTKGVSAARMKVVRESRGKEPEPLSPKAAKGAFRRHFNRRDISERGRKIAMGREMCNATRKTVTDTRYSRRGGPVRYNYPGLDDGSNCKGKVKRTSRKATEKQLAALAKGRETRRLNIQRRARDARAAKRA